MPNTLWYDLGPADAIPPGEGRVFRVDRAQIAVFRTRAGELFATQPHCPHKRGPLADGIVGSGTVVCPLHAYKYDLATGAPVGHQCGTLVTYPVQLGPDGRIELSLVPSVVSAGR
jgi:nitrite reductase (NADH) small subunit